MKKVLFFQLFMIIAAVTQAQTLLFHESFDPSTNADSVCDLPPFINSFALNSRLYNTFPQCDSSIVTQNTTTILSSIAFSTIGYSSVKLKFSQICKIEPTDTAEIMVSVNNAPFYKLTTAEYVNPGNSQFAAAGNIFNSNTYPLVWLPAQNSAKPDQSWWKDETFNIGSVVGNWQIVKIIFILRDGNGNGANYNHGWYIDNVEVTGYPIVGFEQQMHESEIPISPNPFTTTTQITLPQTYHHIALALYDLQGKLLLQQNYTDTDKILLQRNHLNNGLYFLKLTLDGKWVETGKIVVSE